MDNRLYLARQIKRLIDEPDLLPNLRAGIPKVKTIDDEMNEVMALYRHLLTQHERTATPGAD